MIKKSQARFGWWGPGAVCIIFLVLMFLLGGGARSDIASLPLVRGIAVLFAFWAASRMSGDDRRRIRVPLLLLVATTLWMAIQLIPLPPSIWHELPGRSPIVEIDALIGQANLWRPLSLAPSQTLNALLGMSVPIAAVLLASQLSNEETPQLMFALVAIAFVGAIVGLLQIVSGAGSGAYFYRVTNTGAMVGFFANRNHHAVFLACVILLVGMLFRDELMRKRQRGGVKAGLLLAGALLTAMTIFIGSRAGLLAGVIGFAVAYAMVVPAWRARASQFNKSRKGGEGRFSTLFIIVPPVLLAALFSTAFWLTSRSTGVSRAVGEGVAEDLRVQAWPVVQSMIETFWVFGSGFGSFPSLYKVFEPDSLLHDRYYNHVHNDWAEIVLTGGAPFVCIVLIGLIWFGRRVKGLGTRNLLKGQRGDLRLAVAATIFLLAVASFVDYPLRVPSFQAMSIILVVLLCCPKPAKRPRNLA